MGDIEFKDKFIERYSKLTDFEEFKRYSLSFPRRSIRVNTLKTSVDELKERIGRNWLLEQVPWCKEGFWVTHKEGRRDIGNTYEHSLGYYYVQEASSMIPPLALEPKENEVILDMCASPGSKASQIAMYMKNRGVLIANDYKGERLSPLGLNMQRMGITNCILTLMRGQQFKGFEFDRILADAPCSGTGTICKSPRTLKTWNPNVVKRLSIEQKNLISSAFENLKENGTLVYSTCSLEPDEDEAVIDFLLGKYENAKLEKIELEGLKSSKSVLEFEGRQFSKEIGKCLRIWPQDNHTEGFFIAKIKKL